MRDETWSLLSEKTMARNGKSDYSSNVRLVELTLRCQILERYFAIQGDFSEDPKVMNGLKARDIELSSA